MFFGNKIPRTAPIWMRPRRSPAIFFKRYGTRTIILLICIYAFAEKEFSVGLQFGPSSETLSLIQWPGLRSRPVQASAPDDRGNTFSNMLYHRAGPTAKEKRRKQKAYVGKYAKWAQEEMEAYGIPASITLAQGLLESNAGESRLAEENYNHFGIKCFSRTCSKGHCRNFEDDHHKDFFRIYRNEKESFRAHSQLLQAERYAALHQLNPKDYRSWAQGLQEAGYATDKAYAEKLIQLIQSLQLDQYDH